MALLERRARIEIKRIPLSLPVDVVELLEQYAAFLNRDKGEVLAAAVRHAVELDDAFCREAGLRPSGTRRNRRAANATETSSESV